MTVRWGTGRRTLAEAGALEKGGNSFGLLRLLFAAAVIASHTYYIGGFGNQPLYTASHHTTELGSIALAGFFALSGVLVGISAEHSETAQYLWHRARRILPAFWVCLIVTAFGFGALMAAVQHLPLTSITQPPMQSAQTYVVNNFGLGIHQWQVGSVLNALPAPSDINASLWSIAAEATCYLMVLAVVRCWLASKRRDGVIVAAVVISVFLAFAARAAGGINGIGASQNLQLPLLGPLRTELLYPLWAVFITGAALGLWRDRIVLTPMLTVAATAWCVISVPLGLFMPLGSLALPYAVIGIGYYLPTRLRSVGVRSDFSYGLYLYGFPVGMTLVAARPTQWHAWSLMLATLVATFVVAVASWYSVERFFLRPPTARRSRRLGPVSASVGDAPRHTQMVGSPATPEPVGSSLD